MENTQTTPLFEEAKRFIELMKNYHAGDSQPSEFKKQEVYSALHRLEQNGLIAIRAKAEIGDYVLRNTVHGSPSLTLKAPSGSDITFTSLSFAKFCRDLLLETEELQVLLVVG